MKVIGVIPARFASTRFPGKPLIDLKGKPMIQHVYEGASKTSGIAEVIVATDDERIVDAVLKFGGKVQLTSSHHPSGTDRCAEVLTHLSGADVILNIQGDEPLVDPRQLESLVKVFSDPSVEIATLGNRQVTESDLINPNRIKVVLDHQGNALYFSRSAIPNHHHSGGNALENYPYLRHIGLYGYRADVLRKITALEPTALEKTESLEQLRWLYYGYKIRVIETSIETPNIDVPEDVEKVLALL